MRCVKMGVKSTLFYDPLIPRFTTLWDTLQTLLFFNLAHIYHKLGEKNNVIFIYKICFSFSTHYNVVFFYEEIRISHAI